MLQIFLSHSFDGSPLSSRQINERFVILKYSGINDNYAIW